MAAVATRARPADRQTRPALSTVAAPMAAPARPAEMRPALSTVAFGANAIAHRNKVQLAIAMVDPRVTAIERRREAKGISQNELLSLARVHRMTWLYLRQGQQAPRADTLQRLNDALDGMPAKHAQREAVLGFVLACEQVLLHQIAGNRRLIAACDPARKRTRLPTRLPGGRLRLLAVYIAAVELQIGNAELARALGVARQAIKQARDKVEDLRGTGPVDELLDACARLVTGRGA